MTLRIANRRTPRSLLVNAPSLKTGWVNRLVVIIGTTIPVSSSAALNRAMIRSRSAASVPKGIRSSSWNVTPHAPSSERRCTDSIGSRAGRVASPNGSRAGQPTVQSPKLKRSSRVGCGMGKPLCSAIVQTPGNGSVLRVRLATWNVNSALTRLPRLLPWLDERAPDVVCLQETKLSDEAFAEAFDAPLAERGYAVAHHGEGRWNGVALLARLGLDDLVRGLPGEPRFPTPDSPPEARAISATCGGLRITSVYVPNGRSPDDPHYLYKLEWLAALRESITDPARTVVAGDMNIAPTDDDLWDPA